MTKFKVGDRVRITNPNVAAKLGEEFVVTQVVKQKWQEYSDLRFWYKGDSAGHGVWENYLELVEVAR